MKRLHGFALALFAFVGSVLTASAQAPAAPQSAPDVRALIERLDAQTSKEFAKENFASVTVGVVSGPNLAWSKSYGWADIEKKIPATKSTLYRIGSITKEFTALML